MEAEKSTTAYIYSKELSSISSLLPSNRGRSAVVHRLVSSMGIITGENRVVVIRARRASYKELSKYHSRDYLDHVLDTRYRFTGKKVELEGDAEFGLEDDCPAFSGLADYVELVAGGSLKAASVLHSGKADIAIFWDGGRHHTQKSRASGFCYVADCILAILALKKPISPLMEKKRIMYLDLDLHFSDAVSQAFYRPSSTYSQVLTLSIHHSAPGFFPESPLSHLPSLSTPDFDPFTLSVPLHPGASNTTFLRIWPLVQRVRDAFRPNFVVVQCGVDGLAGDPHAIWNWSLGGEGSFGWYIQHIIAWPGRKLLLGGGGYNHPNAARAWAYLTSLSADQPIALHTNVPENSDYLQYAPSFDFDIPSNFMQDQNTEQYLQRVESSFSNVISKLGDLVEK